jgi:hypothetical protein
MSTQLIAKPNLTLADIQVDDVTPAQMKESRAWVVGRARFRRCEYGVVDPRTIYKQRVKDHDIDTMVEDSEVQQLAAKAREVYVRFH